MECENSRSTSSARENSLGCIPCPTGFIEDGYNARCKRNPICPPGSGHNYLSSCEDCDKYDYNDGTHDSCQGCPLGSVGKKKERSTKCIPCPPSTFRNEYYDTKCKQCGRKQNSFVTGARYCVNDNVPCPRNFFKSSTGACLTCSVYERYDKKKKRCLACQANSLSKGGIASKCQSCGPGMRTLPFDKFKRCLCMKGWGFKVGSGGKTCIKCPPGTANSAPSSYCKKCSEDEFAPRSGMGKCMECPKGFNQRRRGQKKCKRPPPCPKGLVRHSENGCVDPRTNCPPDHRRAPTPDTYPPFCGAKTKAACPADTVVELIPDAGFGYIPGLVCERCSPGRRYDAVKLKCIPCKKNETSEGGATRSCQGCPRGFRGFRGECVCELRLQIVNGTCVRCAPGTFGLDSFDGCMPCPVGTFSDRAKLEMCEKCGKGSLTDKAGQSSCRKCAPGLFSSGLGYTGCVRPVASNEKKVVRRVVLEAW